MSAIRPDPTATQRRASDPGHSVWVGASAGTGKTKVLTDRVLRLMLAGTPPDRILCITFTRAAAAEMANRIAATLARWATMPDDKLQLALADLVGAPPATKVQTEARRLFARVLDVPGGMRIQTVHSFCQSLLRRFPVEAGLPPQFELIDDRSAAEMLERVRRQVLEDESLGWAVDRVAASVGADEFGEIVRALVAERGQLTRLLDEHGGLEALVAEIRRALELPEGATADSLLRDACADSALNCDAVRAAAYALLDSDKKSDQDRGTAIANWLEDPDGRAGRWAEYLRGFLTKEGTIYKTLATRSVAAVAGVLEALQAEAERILALTERLRAAETADATAALLALGAALIERYRADKARRALLDYDDLILQAGDLLERPGKSAWVLFKLDGGIDHVLIDEAQDTSPEQWRVVEALTGEFFAGLGAREDVDRTVFVVGDEKQSIFSFQGADPAEFARVHGLFDRRSREAERPFHTIPLETSFRSVAAVLELVDAVFARDPALDGVAPEPPRHFVSEGRRLHGGLVELWPPLGPSESDEPPAWEPPTEQRGISDPGARLAKLIAARIAGWLRDGTILESKGRPIRPGDVLILVRTRNRFFVELMRALKAANVPVGGMDRMVLTEQLAVMDLMALARFLLLPEDDLSLAELLKGPLVGFDDDRLFALAHGRRGTLWGAMAASPDPAVKPARSWLSEILDRVDFQAPFELFSGVLAQPCPGDVISGRRAMLGRLGPEAEDPLDEFLSLALGFERQLPPSLQRFLHWLETGETEVKREQEQGGGQVRIMTVHGSKGLQAPIVILPDLVGMPSRSARAGEKILWPDEALPVPLWAPRAASRPPAYREAMERADRRRAQEYRRLLYVALTRAEDRLYLLGHYATERGKPADGCWYHLVRDGLATLADAATVSIDGVEGEGLRLHRPQADRPAGPEAVAPLAGAEVPAPDWLHRPPPPEPDPTRPLTPSRPEAEPPARSPLEGSDQGRFRRGALIHALLQALPELPTGAREAAARRYLARPQHGRDEAEQAEIVATTLAVLDQPGFEALFGPGSRAEVPVVGLVEGRALSGQIDRLVVTPDSVLVVDYKTNRPPPVSIEAVPRAYLVQMAAYRAALRLVYPGRTVRCALLWTEGPRLMELPPATLDRHAPGASA
ncbi:double-strand break repair helicase AddA [Mycobacterium sp. KBS0706]|uniref:double-strand break repair helicase AddA n=1 Tax=Mycobacterium sp. KBS0706 TaxID=2578109 RepID=UPI00110F99DC|nr:double-strand break repair helicase AddA [Mycobacterium sp. KBS0706]TSD88214.1 double-strand break repair helicase AddA [Mycobacterium sp. KBS0706]